MPIICEDCGKPGARGQTINTLNSGWGQTLGIGEVEMLFAREI